MNLTIHLEEAEERPPLADIATITVDTPDGEVKTFHAAGDAIIVRDFRHLLAALKTFMPAYAPSLAISIANGHGIISDPSTSPRPVLYDIVAGAVSLTPDNPSSVRMVLETWQDEIEQYAQNLQTEIALRQGITREERDALHYRGQRESAFLLECLSFFIAEMPE